MRLCREDIDRNVGLRIRGLREMVGETREHFGLALGVDAETVTAIEAGTRSLDVYQLCLVATLFVQPLDFFLEEDERQGG